MPAKAASLPLRSSHTPDGRIRPSNGRPESDHGEGDNEDGEAGEEAPPHRLLLESSRRKQREALHQRVNFGCGAQAGGLFGVGS